MTDIEIRKNTSVAQAAGWRLVEFELAPHSPGAKYPHWYDPDGYYVGGGSGWVPPVYTSDVAAIKQLIREQLDDEDMLDFIRYLVFDIRGGQEDGNRYSAMISAFSATAPEIVDAFLRVKG